MSNLKNYITTQCGCVDEENKLWFFSNEYNALFCKELHDGECRYIRSFEEEPVMEMGMYTSAFYYDKKIAFIPCIANNIAIYDIENDKLKYIKIQREDYLICYNVISVSEYEILLFPVQYSKYAYILDMKMQDVKKINLDFGKYDKEFSRYTSKSLFLGSGYKENKAYISLMNTDKYLCFDLKDEIIEIKKHKYEILTISGNEENMAALLKDGKNIVFFENDEKIQLKYKNEEDIFSTGINLAYTHTCTMKDITLVLPIYKNPLAIVKNKKIYYVDLDISKYKITGFSNEPFAVSSYDKHSNIYLLPYKTDKLIIIYNDGKVEYEELYMNNNERKKIYENLKKLNPDNKIIKEEVSEIEGFLYDYVDNNNFNKIKSKENEIGNKIWNYVKKDI